VVGRRAAALGPQQVDQEHDQQHLYPLVEDGDDDVGHAQVPAVVMA
jgi:hypothetical protein